MVYYKMPLNTDLSLTTYRCCEYFNNEIYIEYHGGYCDSNWEKVSEELIYSLFPTWFEEGENEQTILTNELTQMDKIEAKLDYLTLSLCDIL